MKFADYLQDIQSTQLSSETKELIFRRFEAKKSQKWFFSRVTNYSRVATLSLVAISLLGILYFSSFGWQNSGEWRAYDGLITFKADPAQTLTYADEIGTIIQTVWGVTITSNGEIKETDSLVSSDKVLLLEWAEMTFSVQDGVQAKIVGPAEFEVEKVGDIYVINMLSGEFVELKSMDPVEDVAEQRVEESPTPSANPTSTSSTLPTQKINIPKKSVQVVIKTPDLEISSNTDDGEIDVTITTQDDGKQLVENTGAELTLTRVIQEESVVTQLDTQQTASINGEITIADIVAVDPQIVLNDEQAQELAATLKEDISISYTIQPDSAIVDTSWTTTDTVGSTPKSTILAQAPKEQWESTIEKNQDTDEVKQDLSEIDAGSDAIVRGVQPILPPDDIDTSLDLDQDTKTSDDIAAPNTAPIDSVPQELVELIQEGTQVEWESLQAEPILPHTAPQFPQKRVVWGTDLAMLQWATNVWWLMNSVRAVVTNYAHGNTTASSNGLVELTNTFAPISSTLIWDISLDRSSPAGLANSLQAMITALESKRFVPPVYINKIKWVIARLRLVQTIPVWSVDPLCDFDCIVNDVLAVPASQRWYLML